MSSGKCPFTRRLSRGFRHPSSAKWITREKPRHRPPGVQVFPGTKVSNESVATRNAYSPKARGSGVAAASFSRARMMPVAKMSSSSGSRVKANVRRSFSFRCVIPQFRNRGRKIGGRDREIRDPRCHELISASASPARTFAHRAPDDNRHESDVVTRELEHRIIDRRAQRSCAEPEQRRTQQAPSPRTHTGHLRLQLPRAPAADRLPGDLKIGILQGRLAGTTCRRSGQFGPVKLKGIIHGAGKKYG